MKYVITGGAGHIGHPLAQALLNGGHEVIVIGRTPEKLQSLVDAGVKAAIGSIEDESFLAATFTGADAVYLMIPPNYGVENLRHFQNTIARNYVAAITAAKVKYVVVLSSIGAHMKNGAGPVDGLADLEDLLSRLEDVNVKFLRPAYFMYNLFNMIPMIKNMHIMGGNFGGNEEKLVLAHTNDIAEAAVQELSELNFSGHSVRYIASDEKTTNEIAEILSAAANKETPWVLFSDEQALEGAKQAGFSETLAEAFTTMGKAIREGKMQEDYWKNHPTLSHTKLEDFAKEFEQAFNANNG
ncbi:MAG: NAD-dependent epimerase/dehydratase family protein [Ferruginibacter sp.]|nr:NAD-dependent epimerase/dehydratase family protein [Ferruginibacter sp.]